MNDNQSFDYNVLQQQEEDSYGDNKQEIQNSLVYASEREKLYQARDKLIEFVNLIGKQRLTPIRQDVIQHYQKYKVGRSQVLNFEKIEKMIKNRIQKMKKNNKIKKNWGKQDIYILMWVVSKYCDFKKIQRIQKDITRQDWNFISQLIPGVDPKSCMFKWLSLKKNKLSDYSWSNNQSLMLGSLVQKYGQKDWGLISQGLYHSTNSPNKIYRCPKQCRQHWNCFLNPQLKKGPWSFQQDYVLLSEIKKKSGQKKWTQLSKSLDGRTQNALKNRYNLLIQKQRQYLQDRNKNMSQIELVQSYLQRNYVTQFVAQKVYKNQPMRKEQILPTYRRQQQQYKPNKRLLRKNFSKKRNRTQNKSQKRTSRRVSKRMFGEQRFAQTSQIVVQGEVEQSEKQVKQLTERKQDNSTIEKNQQQYPYLNQAQKEQQNIKRYEQPLKQNVQQGAQVGLYIREGVQKNQKQLLQQDLCRSMRKINIKQMVVIIDSQQSQQILMQNDVIKCEMSEDIFEKLIKKLKQTKYMNNIHIVQF